METGRLAALNDGVIAVAGENYATAIAGVLYVIVALMCLAPARRIE